MSQDGTDGPDTGVQPVGRSRRERRTAHCPYCELRFEYHEEVRDHIRNDHPDHVDVAVTGEVHELPHA